MGILQGLNLLQDLSLEYMFSFCLTIFYNNVHRNTLLDFYTKVTEDLFFHFHSVERKTSELKLIEICEIEGHAGASLSTPRQGEFLLSWPLLFFEV